MNFNLNLPNYGGRVQYRVILWDNSGKEARNLWTTGDRYYTGWIAPTSTTTFAAGAKMIRVTGDGSVTAMAAPSDEGVYKFYLKE